MCCILIFISETSSLWKSKKKRLHEEHWHWYFKYVERFFFYLTARASWECTLLLQCWLRGTSHADLSLHKWKRWKWMLFLYLAKLESTFTISCRSCVWKTTTVDQYIYPSSKVKRLLTAMHRRSNCFYKNLQRWRTYWSYTSVGVYVPCIYTHARRELP